MFRSTDNIFVRECYNWTKPLEIGELKFLL